MGPGIRCLWKQGDNTRHYSCHSFFLALLFLPSFPFFLPVSLLSLLMSSFCCAFHIYWLPKEKQKWPETEHIPRPDSAIPWPDAKDVPEGWASRANVMWLSGTSVHPFSLLLWQINHHKFSDLNQLQVISSRSRSEKPGHAALQSGPRWSLWCG